MKTQPVLKTYKVEIENDDFCIVWGYSDVEAVRSAVEEVLTRGENHIYALDELDDDYNEIRSIEWRGMLAKKEAAA
jgi:hypothetical protein